MPLHPTVAVDKAERRVSTRATRWLARELLWELDRGEREHRVENCGRYSTGDTVTVKVKVRDGQRQAGFGGVQSCGSVWACPVCSEKINAERQGELQRGIEGWLAAGGAVMFGTATVSHDRDDSLAQLLGVIGSSFSKVVSGSGAAWNGTQGKPRWFRGGKKLAADAELIGQGGEFVGKYSRWSAGDKSMFGIEGYCRVVEIKHGAHGWHPHVHFLLFLDAPLHPRRALELQDRLFGRWESALADKGYRTLPGIGMDLRPVRAGEGLADYFTKSNYATSATGAAYEVTGSVTKREGKGGRTPFDLLRDVVELGDADALDLWMEYEAATVGQRQLTWSRGLRQLLALGDERTEEEIVEDDAGGDIVATIDGTQFGRIAAMRRGLEVLVAAEKDDGGRALRRVLDRLGVIPLTEFTHSAA